MTPEQIGLISRVQQILEKQRDPRYHYSHDWLADNVSAIFNGLQCQLSEAQAENKQLRDDLFQTAAYFAESGAKNADSVRSVINAVGLIEKSLQEAQAERDALQARIDGALAALRETYIRGGHATKEAIKILTGEGES